MILGTREQTRVYTVDKKENTKLLSNKKKGALEANGKPLRTLKSKARKIGGEDEKKVRSVFHYLITVLLTYFFEVL